MKTLTLQEYKDAIAQKYERANWEVITQEMHKGETDWIDMELMITEAATLFAEQDKWVSVEDDMPHSGTVVITYCPNVVGQGYCYDGKWYKFHNMGEADPQYWSDVTHWQPLPAAPNSSKNSSSSKSECCGRCLPGQDECIYD